MARIQRTPEDDLDAAIREARRELSEAAAGLMGFERGDRALDDPVMMLTLSGLAAAWTDALERDRTLTSLRAGREAAVRIGCENRVGDGKRFDYECRDWVKEDRWCSRCRAVREYDERIAAAR